MCEQLGQKQKAGQIEGHSRERCHDSIEVDIMHVCMYKAYGSLNKALGMLFSFGTSWHNSEKNDPRAMVHVDASLLAEYFCKLALQGLCY
jgi:hypothetical protein